MALRLSAAHDRHGRTPRRRRRSACCATSPRSSSLQVSVKGPADFVSQADLRAEQTLREELNKARPGYAFLMEESGASGSRQLGLALGGRSAGRHHQLPARHSALGDQHRRWSGACRTAAPNWPPAWSTRPTVDEMFWAEKGARRLRQRAPAARLRPARHEGGGVRHRHSRSPRSRRATGWPSPARWAR